MSATWTIQDRDRLKAAILTGTKSIQMGGRRQEFHSLAEMQSLLESIEKSLAIAATPARRQPRRAVMRVVL